VTDIAGEHELDHVRTCSVLVGNKHGQTTERCIEHDDGNRIAWKIEQDSTGFGRMVSDWQAGSPWRRATAQRLSRPRALSGRTIGSSARCSRSSAASSIKLSARSSQD
jgi:hypothetical protein